MTTDESGSTLTTTARTTAGAIALAALAALGIQTTLGDGGLLPNAAGLMRFFTIWGNVAAMLVMAWAAFGKPPSRAVMAALVTALFVIGSVYWLALSGDHHPVGIDRVTNQFHHTIIPIAVIGWWLRFVPPASTILPLIPAIMVPPLSYGAFAFALGELTGFYAYFFMDLPKLGWAQFLINNAVLAGIFAVVGAGLLGLKRALIRFA